MMRNWGKRKGDGNRNCPTYTLYVVEQTTLESKCEGTMTQTPSPSDRVWMCSLLDHTLRAWKDRQCKGRDWLLILSKVYSHMLTFSIKIWALLMATDSFLLTENLLSGRLCVCAAPCNMAGEGHGSRASWGRILSVEHHTSLVDNS